MNLCKITFYPWGKTINVARGTDLLSAAMVAGIHLYNTCGGEGVCGRCKVIVKKGEIHTESTERLTTEEKKKGYVLACRTTCLGDVDIEVQYDSIMDKAEILTGEAQREDAIGLYMPSEKFEKAPDVTAERIFTHSPLSKKLYLELPPPSLDDSTGDLERIYQGIRKRCSVDIMQMGLANIKKLGKILRDSNWKITVTLGNRNGTTEIVLVEPGDTEKANFGVALDIGTSTIVAYLVDLNSQELIGAKASYNPQVTIGGDVISRIIYAQEEEGLERLHNAVVDAINGLIISLVREHSLSLKDITGVTCAGNTTMTHLLTKIDPTYIRKEPYVPVTNSLPVVRAREIDIKINPRGLLACLPGVSTYVGGDITAGVLASGMDTFSTLSLFLDLGTNGEVVLGNKEWLTCCSTSAGPCFEGGGIQHGVRAMEGAIQKVNISLDREKISYSTIGNARPIGICGSGIVDIISELFIRGIVNRAGKMNPQSSTRVRGNEREREFLLVKKNETPVDKDIVITETDIKNVIHSKGAIFNGASVLLHKLGLSFGNLARVIIAGGLGTSLDIRKAIIIGLLPDLPQEKFTFIGNSSITGAKMALLSQEAMEKIYEISNKMTYVELSVDPEFMNNYTSALFIPHTDLSLFPSVRKMLEKDR